MEILFVEENWEKRLQKKKKEKMLNVLISCVKYFAWKMYDKKGK